MIIFLSFIIIEKIISLCHVFQNVKTLDVFFFTFSMAFFFNQGLPVNLELTGNLVREALGSADLSLLPCQCWGYRHPSTLAFYVVDGDLNLREHSCTLS